jgi:hypothetical protein
MEVSPELLAKVSAFGKQAAEDSIALKTRLMNERLADPKYWRCLLQSKAIPYLETPTFLDHLLLGPDLNGVARMHLKADHLREKLTFIHDLTLEEARSLFLYLDDTTLDYHQKLRNHEFILNHRWWGYNF